MLSLDEIEKTILELESKDTTFSVCERLAPLYIVRDHLRQYNGIPDQKLNLNANSEFLQAINGRNQEEVFRVMDDLMDAVQTLHPKMYDSVLDKIKEI